MIAADILKKWIQYAEYDPDERSFNLNSLHYVFHNCCDTIRDFLKYDPDANLSVLYAKHCYLNALKECKMTLFDLFDDPDGLAEERQMWQLFHGKEVRAIEDAVLDSFDSLLDQVIPVKMLGQRNTEAERNALYDSIEAIATSLDKCNTDLFLRGGPIARITNFSTHIHVFETLADCLIALESAKDGLYLCYILCGGTADGYFGFFLKSNGNILSINERINESFPGSHHRSRNARWSESKKYELFPYNFIFSFQEHDYKGIATKHIIDTNKLAFFQLAPKAYMPLVIAMLLLTNRYTDFDTSQLPIQFVDSLLPVNLALPTPGVQALTVPSNSAIALYHDQLEIGFTAEDVKLGKHNELLGRPVKEGAYSEFYDYTVGDEDIFIELYGKDFQLDISSLLESNRHLKKLTSTELATTKELPNAEFVGTEERMRTIAYMNARTQLASHIRKNMLAAYHQFGGALAVRNWWRETLLQNKDRIYALCVERFHKGDSYKWSDAKDENIPWIHMTGDTKDRSYNGKCESMPFNLPPTTRSGYADWGKALCCITGQLASCHFFFNICSWQDMGWLIGSENIPDILKGFKERGHRRYGNNILSVTDPMTEVGTPFEEHESQINRDLWTDSKWDDHYFHSHHPQWPHIKAPDTALKSNPVCDFSFSISFSKRGLAQLVKEAQNG